MKSRGAWGALALFVCWSIALFAFDLRYHEFWRDEANAILEARAVTWQGLMPAMRLEGVPPLFHALLKVVSAVLPKTQALAAVGAFGSFVLLAGTYRLLVSISGAPRRAACLTLALAPSYTYAYELGVIVRQYGLGLGLSLLAASYLRDALQSKRRRDVVLGAFTGSLAALTAAHASCVAGAVFLAFGLVSLSQPGGVRRGFPVLFALPCFLLVLWLAGPHPGRTPTANVDLGMPFLGWLELGAQAFVEGLAPQDFWYASHFSPVVSSKVLMSLRVTAVPGALLAFVVVIFFGPAGSRRSLVVFDAIAATAGAVPLTEIFADHYWGSHRHHLFLVVPPLLFAFGRAIATPPPGAARPWAGRLGLVLFAPWFGLQLALSASAFALDRRYPFSDTKNAASVLPPGARVVAENDWRTVGILLYRDDIQLRALEGKGRIVAYIKPDASWLEETPLGPLLLEECRQEGGPLFFATRRTAPPYAPECHTRFEYPRSPLPDQPATWEVFDLYTVDCKCVLDAPPP